MQLQLKSLYTRGKNKSDKLFYFAMIIGTNLSLYKIPLLLIPLVSSKFGKKWWEASKN